MSNFRLLIGFIAIYFAVIVTKVLDDSASEYDFISIAFMSLGEISGAALFALLFWALCRIGQEQGKAFDRGRFVLYGTAGIILVIFVSRPYINEATTDELSQEERKAAVSTITDSCIRSAEDSGMYEDQNRQQLHSWCSCYASHLGTVITKAELEQLYDTKQIPPTLEEKMSKGMEVCG